MNSRVTNVEGIKMGPGAGHWVLKQTYGTKIIKWRRSGINSCNRRKQEWQLGDGISTRSEVTDICGVSTS